ncbi:MAG: hypothetical protein PVF65_02380 [Sphingomonadales bacterium]|jgi:hypothetical protein
MKPDNKKHSLKVILASVLMMQAGSAWAQGTDQADEDGFLYFKDAPEQESPQNLNIDAATLDAEIQALGQSRNFIDIDRDGSLADEADKDRFVVPFTPRKLDTQITLLFADGKQDNDSFQGQFNDYITPGGSGIELALKSQFEQQETPPLSLAFNPGAQSSFIESRSNVALELSFSNLSFDAGVNRRHTAFDDLYYGVDLGLRYTAKSWRTSLQITGQQAERTSNFIDLSGTHDRFFAVELGAAYDLTPSWSLTGGLRYSGFKDNLDFGLDDGLSDGRVFMGTALTF